MCGILCVLAEKGRFNEEKIRGALNKIEHRGPDSLGVKRIEINDHFELWLGHARLSIIDLSAAAHQPLSIDRGGLSGDIIFNGELYNFRDLRQAWKDPGFFQTRSDTEVLLAGILKEGPDFFKKTNAMHATVAYNRNTKEMILARDRLGKKPMYIYENSDILICSSELKAIAALNVPLSVDENALAFFHWLGFIPFEKTIYKECRKMPAGSFEVQEIRGNHISRKNAGLYWNPLSKADQKFKGRYEDAIEEFEALLDDAVRIRLESDVPVGVFLSGGIDSTLILSSAVKMSSSQVRAFTAKFTDQDYDESALAVATARHFGASIQLLPIDNASLSSFAELIPRHYDEPFSDSSQIPTMAISKLAREHVTVILTGDGGDEVFLGYPRYLYPRKIANAQNRLKWLPYWKPMFKLFLQTPAGERIVRSTLKSLNMSDSNLYAKIYKLQSAMQSSDSFSVYDSVVGSVPRDRLVGAEQNFLGDKTLMDWAHFYYPQYAWDKMQACTEMEQLSLLDLIVYLRDDVLVKVDRGTMAFGLEARSPLLDYRIVEFGISLPHDFKYDAGVFKRILRDTLNKRMPKNGLTQLGKRGFSTPLPFGFEKQLDKNQKWNLFVENEWRKAYEQA